MKNRVWRAGGQKEPRARALMLSSYSVPIDSALQPPGQERANEWFNYWQHTTLPHDEHMLPFHPLPCRAEEVRKSVTECCSPLQLSSVHGGRAEKDILTSSLLRSGADFNALESLNTSSRKLRHFCLILSFMLWSLFRWMMSTRTRLNVICVCWMSIISSKCLESVSVNAIGAVQ